MVAGKLIKIGDFARRLGIAVSTVRKYEAAGVVIPVRTAGKHRLFSEDDLSWLASVRTMIKGKRMTLGAIKRLIAMVPCWEIRKCSIEVKLNCPAYTNDSTPCWLIEEAKQACSSSNCRICIFYKSVTHCGNLKVLLTELAYSRD
ncbi:MAG: MerR family transcriptional regulator [Candidatus Kryptoniota bacterium]